MKVPTTLRRFAVAVAATALALVSLAAVSTAVSSTTAAPESSVMLGEVEWG